MEYMYFLSAFLIRGDGVRLDVKEIGYIIRTKNAASLDARIYEAEKKVTKDKEEYYSIVSELKSLLDERNDCYYEWKVRT